MLLAAQIVFLVVGMIVHFMGDAEHNGTMFVTSAVGIGLIVFGSIALFNRNRRNLLIYSILSTGLFLFTIVYEMTAHLDALTEYSENPIEGS